METWLIVLLVVVLLGGGAGVTLVGASSGPLGPGRVLDHGWRSRISPYNQEASCEGSSRH